VFPGRRFRCGDDNAAADAYAHASPGETMRRAICQSSSLPAHTSITQANDTTATPTHTDNKGTLPMNRGFRLSAAAGAVFVSAAATFALTVTTLPKPATADDCANGGTIRLGVEPYDTSARLTPIYEKIGKLIGDKIGCKVEVYVATGYNAEIEAMRNGKLEVAEFGPLGYVLAHQIAKAEAVAAFGNIEGKPVTYWASVVTYPGSGIKTMSELRGHSFAFSDAASTSGHLFPAYGLRKAGLDPDKDIKAIYAGSHTASFEALYNHKVDGAELNSEQLESATQRGHYKDGEVVFLWKSDPIPTDPVAIRGDLPGPFKKKLTEALAHLDLMSLDAAERKIMVGAGITQLVPQPDSAYDGIRDLVKTLNIDLEKLG
jgi:phosphonate transport system substrate-binding protein